MASIRHGMVTRTFDKVKYEIETIDKAGVVRKETREKICNLDDKALREWEGREAYKAGTLVISLEVKSRSTGLYGQTPETFIKHSIKLK